MKRIVSFCFFNLLIFLSIPLVAQTTFEVDAPRMVYQGERFSVRFVANANIDNFTSPSFSGAQLLAGPSPSSMRSVQIINGQRSEKVENSYTFILQAGDQSVIAISSASATIGGNVYNSRPLTIEVVSQSSSASSQSYSNQGAPSNTLPSNGYDSDQNYQDEGITYDKADIFLSLGLNKTKVVKGEPIVATLKLYTRSGIAGFEDFKSPVFNGFWSQEIEAPNNINFQSEKVGNQIYRSALLRRFVLIPQQTGNLSIDPAELVCQVQVMQRPQRGRSIFDDFFGDDSYTIERKKLSTGKKTITVSPLPDGAPQSFGGGVGRFNLSVKLDKDSIKSNQATFLLVEISGSGNLNLIEQPNIELPSDFERYDIKSTNSYSNSAEGVTGKKVFELPFIPRNEGEYEIPAIEYSYYDISQKKYITLTSQPKILKVLKGDSSQPAVISSNNQREVGNLGEDIRYIYRNGSSDLKKESSFNIASLWYYLLILLILILSYLVYRILRHNDNISKDVIRMKNKRANKVAMSKLNKAKGYMQNNMVQEFYEELHKAMLGYVGDKLSIPFANMQKSTIEEELLNRGVDESKVQEFIKLLDDCDAVRYSPQGADSAMDAQYNKGVELISHLENKL